MSTAAIQDLKPRVVLIDLSSLYWTAFHATAKESVSDGKNLTLAAVRRIQAEYPGLLAICCDSGKSFRHALNPEYKAGRPERPLAAWGEFDRTKERLTADGLLLWTVQDFEADDIIATATQHARMFGHEVLIASADKDLLQLVGGGVRQLRTHTWKEGGAAEVRETFGVGPSQVRDWLALTGDTADNIKGCPGCGPKKATALLTKFVNLEGLYAQLAVNEKAVAEALGSNNPKPWELEIIKSLKASEADVMLARKLIELRKDVPIVWAEIYEERKAQPLTTFTDEPPREPDEDDDEVPASSIDSIVQPEMDQLAAETIALADKVFPPPATAPAAEPPKDATISIGELVEMKPESKVPPAEKRLALVAQPFDRQLEPSSLKEAFWLAQGMWESRLYQKFGGPHAIWATMIRGREMGFPALTSLDLFHIIDGKPTLAALTIIALAQREPDCEYMRLIHSGYDYAEWEFKHRKHAEPLRHRYDIEDAINAGHCGAEIVPRTAAKGQKDARGQWDKSRKEMLRKTAGVQGVRIVFSGSALGLIYSSEEMGLEVD